MAIFPATARGMACQPSKARGSLPTRVTGRALALLDSIEITRQRTAAATAVAVQYLARSDAHTATICGCGEQARIQLKALQHKLDLDRVFAWDIDPQVARRFSAQMATEFGLEVTPVDVLRDA